MSDINQFVFTGNLTRDAEMRATKEGKNFLSFSVANTTGSSKHTEFVNCSIYNEKWASAIQGFLTKGLAVSVVGSVRSSAYMGKDGALKSSLFVAVTDLKVMGRRQKEEDIALSIQEDKELDLIPF